MPGAHSPPRGRRKHRRGPQGPPARPITTEVPKTRSPSCLQVSSAQCLPKSGNSITRQDPEPGGRQVTCKTRAVRSGAAAPEQAPRAPGAQSGNWGLTQAAAHSG